MSTILHVAIYIPVSLAVGAYLYRYRTQVTEVSHRVAARLKALR